MKIMLVHNAYRQPGGEDGVFQRECALLAHAGHQVFTYSRSNHEVENYHSIRQVELAANAIWSGKTQRDFRALLHECRPDLVHIHNTFIMISPSVYFACSQENIPVVQTLHNFRLICPAATLFRDGHSCQECLDHSLWHSVVHGCYRHSRSMTGVVAAMLKMHRIAGTWKSLIHTYIALTEFSRSKFASAGIPADRIVVKPNFVDPDPGVAEGVGRYALFVGRMTPEKGVHTLCAAWESMPRDALLRCAGDGPLLPVLRQNMEAAVSANVRFEGQKSFEEILQLIKGSRFIVVPSEWPEQFPLVLVEAFACGIPVIASDAPSLGDIVSDHESGLIFRAGDISDLVSKLRLAWEQPNYMHKLGRAARSEYEQKYTAKRNLEMLIRIYEGTRERRTPVTTAFEKAA